MSRATSVRANVRACVRALVCVCVVWTRAQFGTKHQNPRNVRVWPITAAAFIISIPWGQSGSYRLVFFSCVLSPAFLVPDKSQSDTHTYWHFGGCGRRAICFPDMYAGIFVRKLLLSVDLAQSWHATKASSLFISHVMPVSAARTDANKLRKRARDIVFSRLLVRWCEITHTTAAHQINYRVYGLDSHRVRVHVCVCVG